MVLRSCGPVAPDVRTCGLVVLRTRRIADLRLVELPFFRKPDREVIKLIEMRILIWRYIRWVTHKLHLLLWLRFLSRTVLIWSWDRERLTLNYHLRRAPVECKIHLIKGRYIWGLYQYCSCMRSSFTHGDGIVISLVHGRSGKPQELSAVASINTQGYVVQLHQKKHFARYAYCRDM